MNITAWLLALVGPLVARVLLSLGVSVAIFVGAGAVINALIQQLLDNLALLPVAVLQLGGLFGVWQAVSILLGAVTFGVTWFFSAPVFRIVGAGNVA